MNEEYGTCCYCGGFCNQLSQSCGQCSRTLTGYAIGINPLPTHLEYIYADEDQLHTNVKCQDSFIFNEKVWIGDPKVIYPDEYWNEFSHRRKNIPFGMVRVRRGYTENQRDENKEVSFFFWKPKYEDEISIEYTFGNKLDIIGKCQTSSGIVAIVPTSALSYLSVNPKTRV